MKINSGTFLSYLQLKESKNNCVQRLVEDDPQSDNIEQEPPNSNTDALNYGIFLTGLYNINGKFDIDNGNVYFSQEQIKNEGLNKLSVVPGTIKEKLSNDSLVISVNDIIKYLNNFCNTEEKLKSINVQDYSDNTNQTKYTYENNKDIIDALKQYLIKFCASITTGSSTIKDKNIIITSSAPTILLVDKVAHQISQFCNSGKKLYDGIIITNCDNVLGPINPQTFKDNLKIFVIQDSPNINKLVNIPKLQCSCNYVVIRNTGITKLIDVLPQISNLVEQFVVEDNVKLTTLDGAPAKCKQIKINNNKKIIEWNWDPTDVEYAQIRNNGDGNDAYNKFITSLTENNKKLEDGESLITDTSFFEVSESKDTCTLNTQLTSADLSNGRIFEISKDAATFKYKTEFSKKAKQNLLFGTTIKRNEYTNSENIDGIELGSFINFPSEKIDGTIDVSGNTKVSSFEGITPFIGGDLLLSECREITNLEFFPKQIGGNLDLSNCKKLTELGKTFVDRDYAIQVGGILNVTNTPLFDKITELLPSGKKFTDFFDVKGKIVGNDKLGSNNQNTEKIIANSDGTYTCVESVGYEDLIVYVEGYDAKTNKATGKKFSVKFKEAKKDFDISGLPITTFEGCPKKVGGSFNRREGKWLTGEWKHPNASTVSITDNNLKDAPDEVGGSYIVIGCKSIKSLEGAPNKCKNFSANDTSIKNLKGGPADVEGFYYVRDCKDLESLEGLPNKVGDLFSIRGCLKLNGIKKSQNVKLLKDKLTKKDYGRIEWPDAGSLKAGVKSALKGVWDKVKLFSIDDVKDDDTKDDKNDQKKQ